MKNNISKSGLRSVKEEYIFNKNTFVFFKILSLKFLLPGKNMDRSKGVKHLIWLGIKRIFHV